MIPSGVNLAEINAKLWQGLKGAHLAVLPFYFSIGGLAVVAGIGIFVLGCYRGLTGEHLSKKALIAPVFMAVLGFQ